jgi:hypothetical protein
MNLEKNSEDSFLTDKQARKDRLVPERLRKSSSVSTSGGLLENGRTSGYFLNILQSQTKTYAIFVCENIIQ